MIRLKLEILTHLKFQLPLSQHLSEQGRHPIPSKTRGSVPEMDDSLEDGPEAVRVLNPSGN
jgi:hypothetical protein